MEREKRVAVMIGAALFAHPELAGLGEGQEHLQRDDALRPRALQVDVHAGEVAKHFAAQLGARDQHVQPPLAAVAPRLGLPTYTGAPGSFVSPALMKASAFPTSKPWRQAHLSSPHPTPERSR